MDNEKYLWDYNRKAYRPLYTVNLQLFAEGDKTEKATPKRRQDARKKGQVLQSREITSALVLISLFIALKVFGGYMYTTLTSFTKRVLTQYPTLWDIDSFSVLSRLFTESVTVLFKATLPMFATALVVGLATSYAQVGFIFTMETLGFKFSKINPLNGLKRVFSLNSVFELVKSLIKVGVIGYIAYAYLKGEAANVLNLMDMDAMGIAVFTGDICINVALRICVALIILGILDYAYQWWQYEKNLRMSKQEVKEEFKQTEGNPEIKAKIKQKQRQISMRRMLQEVPKADVVITNPTHFAVALKYDTKVAEAPVVIAKGQDFIALRIKEAAKEHSVEVVENKPLARALYETVEIGQTVPPELYQAVAEVLAFVFSLKNKNAAG